MRIAAELGKFAGYGAMRAPGALAPRPVPFAPMPRGPKAVCRGHLGADRAIPLRAVAPRRADDRGPRLRRLCAALLRLADRERLEVVAPGSSGAGRTGVGLPAKGFGAHRLEAGLPGFQEAQGEPPGILAGMRGRDPRRLPLRSSGGCGRPLRAGASSPQPPDGAERPRRGDGAPPPRLPSLQSSCGVHPWRDRAPVVADVSAPRSVSSASGDRNG